MAEQHVDAGVLNESAIIGDSIQNSRQLQMTQVEVLVYALVEAAHDKEDDVKISVVKSLHTLGCRKPELVLEICFQYLQKFQKLTVGHRTQILSSIARICQDCLDKVPASLASELVKLAIQEMVFTKDVVPDWQGAASSILVALGKRYCFEVMEALHMQYQPGVIPHFFIVQTLGNLATANVNGMVPFLKAIVQTTLTILGIVRHDNMKWVLAYALARFSEAILEYIANIEKAPDPTVKKEVYSTELSLAYTTLFNSWFSSKEPKVAFSVVEAVGYATQLMSTEKLEEELPKLVPAILNLYKRFQDAHHITQGLYMVLDASVKSHCCSLEPLLDIILNSLFPQVCAIPDYTRPQTVKNHCEVLRCFDVLACLYADKIVNYLLFRVESSNDAMKIGSLTVLRHLINASESQLSSKISTVIVGLKCMTQEPNNKVKKIFAQLIVALAHHGFLELDGSHDMVEFIIQQCALPDDPLVAKKTIEADHVSNESLRAMCSSILHLLTTTVEKMTPVLWPHILEYLIPEALTNAIGAICKSAAYLATKLKEENRADFEIDYDRFGNIPKPLQIIARLVVLLGHPRKGNNRGIYLMRLIKALASNLDKNLVSCWDSNIPKLLQYFEEHQEVPADSFQNEWETLVVKFLEDSVNEVDSQDWICKLVKALCVQIQLYDNFPDDKAFCYKCICTVLKKCNNKTVVNEKLDLILQSVKHNNATERNGCAVAVGICASTHTDAVLVKLDQIARSDAGKKSKLLSFLMDVKGDVDPDKVKTTIILSYGQVCLRASSLLLTARIETPILRNVSQYFQQSKDLDMKLALISMVDMVAQAMHPSRVGRNVNFPSKADLLRQMEQYLQAEIGSPLSSSTRAMAIVACTSLIKLDPIFTEEEKTALMKTCLVSVYTIPKLEMLMRDADIKMLPLLEKTMQSLDDVVREFVIRDMSSANAYSLFQCLETWLVSSETIHRERSAHSTVVLLSSFLENINLAFANCTTFELVGAIVARLVPRCTDPASSYIRELALRGIYLSFKILSRFEGFSVEHNDVIVESLLTLQDKVDQDDPNVLFVVTNDLAKVISAKLPVEQVAKFIEVLLDGLLDAQDRSSSGTCVVLNKFLKLKGAAVHHEMEILIQHLHVQLGEITCAQTRKGSLQIIRTLAGFHLNTVLTSLLSYPLPYDRVIRDWWKMLAQDSQLSFSVIDQFCNVLKHHPPYEEYPDPRDRKSTVRVATWKPLCVMNALREMLKVAEIEATAAKEFDRLFTLLLLMVGSYVGVLPPTVIQDSPKEPNAKPVIVVSVAKTSKIIPVRTALDCLTAFLTSTNCGKISDDMSARNVWIHFEDPNKSTDAIAALASSLKTYNTRCLPGVVSCLNSHLNSAVEQQRIVTVAFFAQLVSHHLQIDQALLEILLNGLLGRLVDNSRTVRKLCIRGLGSVGKLDPEILDSLEWFGVYKYFKTVLSAMIAGLNDKDDPNGDVTLEAMNGLCRLLEHMNTSHIDSILINLVLSIRPFFEKERVEIRASAFTLLGKLAKICCSDNSEEMSNTRSAFFEQIQCNMVCLLVHLNDEEKSVSKACKYALRCLGPLLGSENIVTMFEKHLPEHGHLHYGEFMADLTKYIASELKDRIPLYIGNSVSYFKSSWSIIRCNGAMIVGYLLGNISQDTRGNLKNEAVFGALTLLLKDPAAEVRIKAAEAISQLHAY